MFCFYEVEGTDSSVTCLFEALEHAEEKLSLSELESTEINVLGSDGETIIATVNCAGAYPSENCEEEEKAAVASFNDSRQ